jgi:hypothetical protein
MDWIHLCLERDRVLGLYEQNHKSQGDKILISRATLIHYVSSLLGLLIIQLKAKNNKRSSVRIT